MAKKILKLSFIIMLLIFGCSYGISLFNNLNPVPYLRLPDGFSISIYAKVPDARSMTLAANDVVFVGTRQDNKVYALLPNSSKTAAEKVITVAENLDTPNGVTFSDGNLYVAENHRILRYKDILKHLDNTPSPEVLFTNLPNEKDHGWRYMRIGPDHKLYLGIGAPCNACLRGDSRFASIVRLNPDGSDFEVFASGVRNTVGFDWDNNGKLWFTDNGRDLMGDDIPPDELNVADQAGLHFGFPYIHGKNIVDPTYNKFPAGLHFTPPVLEIQAHSATLGMLFYKGKMFPPQYHDQIFIAEHGSWNRSSKVGYQVISVESKNQNLMVKPFITGWLQGNKVIGRPVDILMLSDGSLLISDDYAGLIYRVSYHSS